LREIWGIKLSTSLSLAIVAGILVLSIMISIIAARRRRAKIASIRVPNNEPHLPLSDRLSQILEHDSADALSR